MWYKKTIFRIWNTFVAISNETVPAPLVAGSWVDVDSVCSSCGQRPLSSYQHLQCSEPPFVPIYSMDRMWPGVHVPRRLSQQTHTTGRGSAMVLSSVSKGFGLETRQGRCSSPASAKRGIFYFSRFNHSNFFSIFFHFFIFILQFPVDYFHYYFHLTKYASFFIICFHFFIIFYLTLF
jgi:hypothetical protein